MEAERAGMLLPCNDTRTELKAGVNLKWFMPAFVLSAIYLPIGIYQTFDIGMPNRVCRVYFDVG